MIRLPDVQSGSIPHYVTPVHSRLLSDIEGNPIHEQQTAKTG
jgi:hypothetical protein